MVVLWRPKSEGAEEFVMALARQEEISMCLKTIVELIHQCLNVCF